ncbi:ATP-binding protein [Actinotalea sp.]|uniref:ATP-binding protein n=1 Tax=Actinotalea sp. TaxID=1872145 RepID=UPI003568174E
MPGDRERRTTSGRTLRLVGVDDSVEMPSPAPPADAEQTVVLPGHRQSVAVGRHWVVGCASGHGLNGVLGQILELLSSELLTNAVLHGADGGPVALALTVDSTSVRVSVSDGAASAPVVLHSAPSDLNGRGMAIVEAMSQRWGVENHAEGGKTVWFELDRSEF